MKTLFITPLPLRRHAGWLAVALAAASLGAQAADALPLTRAEAQAELLRARAAGELPSAADLHGPLLDRALRSAARARTAPSPAIAAVPASATGLSSGMADRPAVVAPADAAPGERPKAGR